MIIQYKDGLTRLKEFEYITRSLTEGVAVQSHIWFLFKGESVPDIADPEAQFSAVFNIADKKDDNSIGSAVVWTDAREVSREDIMAATQQYEIKPTENVTAFNLSEVLCYLARDNDAIEKRPASVTKMCLAAYTLDVPTWKVRHFIPVILQIQRAMQKKED